jgi:hypothetical protein
VWSLATTQPRAAPPERTSGDPPKGAISKRKVLTRTSLLHKAPMLMGWLWLSWVGGTIELLCVWLAALVPADAPEGQGGGGLGTWGPGNFDGDGAVDYLSEVIDGFIETVEQLFALGRASLDDQGDDRLMPTVEMISVLCDWCRGEPPAIRVVAPPRPGVVRQWKRRYLEIYDEEIDGLLLPGKEHFGPERRAHIVRTFDRLELLATEGWEERPATSS